MRELAVNHISHGGGAIIFAEKQRLRTISKYFLTVLWMVCKFKFVPSRCSLKNSGQLAYWLIFNGPRKLEDPYFLNSESKRNREIKIFFDFFLRFSSGCQNWTVGFCDLIFLLIVSFGFILSVYGRASNIPIERCLFCQII